MLVFAQAIWPFMSRTIQCSHFIRVWLEVRAQFAFKLIVLYKAVAMYWGGIVDRALLGAWTWMVLEDDDGTPLVVLPRGTLYSRNSVYSSLAFHPLSNIPHLRAHILSRQMIQKLCRTDIDYDVLVKETGRKAVSNHHEHKLRNHDVAAIITVEGVYLIHTTSQGLADGEGSRETSIQGRKEHKKSHLYLDPWIARGQQAGRRKPSAEAGASPPQHQSTSSNCRTS